MTERCRRGHGKPMVEVGEGEILCNSSEWYKIHPSIFIFYILHCDTLMLNHIIIWFNGAKFISIFRFFIAIFIVLLCKFQLSYRLWIILKFLIILKFDLLIIYYILLGFHFFLPSQPLKIVVPDKGKNATKSQVKVLLELPTSDQLFKISKSSRGIEKKCLKPSIR